MRKIGEIMRDELTDTLAPRGERGFYTGKQAQG